MRLSKCAALLVMASACLLGAQAMEDDSRMNWSMVPQDRMFDLCRSCLDSGCGPARGSQMCDQAIMMVSASQPGYLRAMASKSRGAVEKMSDERVATVVAGHSVIFKLEDYDRLASNCRMIAESDPQYRTKIDCPSDISEQEKMSMYWPTKYSARVGTPASCCGTTGPKPPYCDLGTVPASYKPDYGFSMVPDSLSVCSREPNIIRFYMTEFCHFSKEENRCALKGSTEHVKNAIAHVGSGGALPNDLEGRMEHLPRGNDDHNRQVGRRMSHLYASFKYAAESCKAAAPLHIVDYSMVCGPSARR